MNFPLKKRSCFLLCVGVLILMPLLHGEVLTRDELVRIVREKRWQDLPPTITSPRDGVEMILIPGGEFQMGLKPDSPLAEKYPDALPAHKVHIDPFYIDKHEVTNTHYAKYVEETGVKSSLFSNNPVYNGSQQPVVGIRYGDAVSYAQWVGKRLPTEAEWEKAARGADGRIFPWGSEFSSDKCNAYPNQINAPQKVGTYPEGASPYGVMDMAGNVSEWVYDLYGRYYYQNSPSRNPRGPVGKGEARIVRGGNYKSDPDDVMSVVRFQAGAYAAFPSIGFRCVVSAADIENLYDPTLGKKDQEAVSSGVTVISKEQTGTTVISDNGDRSFYHDSPKDFKPVRYFRYLGFKDSKCVGNDEIRKSERKGIHYWKVYYNAPALISQAQFYDIRERLMFHIEPVYDDDGREKQVKLFDNQGRMIYRSERVFKDGRPVRGILYSPSGDYLGEEKF